MGTVIQEKQQGNDDRHQRWERCERADLFAQYSDLHKPRHDILSTSGQLNLLYAPLTIPLMYFHIKYLQRASSVARPLRGGEKRTAGRVSHHEEL